MGVLYRRMTYKIYMENRTKIFEALCSLYEDWLKIYLQERNDKLIDIKEVIKYYEKTRSSN